MKLLRKYFPGINYALHKRIINFQSRLILNKQKRHNWKNLKRQNLTTNLIKNSSFSAVNNIKAESYIKALFSNTIKVKDIFNITDL